MFSLIPDWTRLDSNNNSASGFVTLRVAFGDLKKSFHGLFVSMKCPKIEFSSEYP